MLSKKTWFLIASALIVFGVWQSVQTIAFVYGERNIDGVVVQSKVVCGNAFGNVLLSRFDDRVLGPATAADCVRLARTHILEVVALVGGGIFLAWFGRRHGKEPPRPIDEELPRLPVTPPSVEGRKRTPAEG